MLRILKKDHNRSNIIINFSEPLGMNYQDLLADSLFIYEKILDERRNSEVEIISTILLLDRFQPIKYNEICHQYSRARQLTHHSLHYPEKENQKIHKDVDTALKMLTYSFDGILEFNSKYEFVYQPKDGDIKSYKKDLLILSTIKDRMLFNSREVFIESIISASVYPEIQNNSFIELNDSQMKFLFLAEIF
jgi:hypothetical protein